MSDTEYSQVNRPHRKKSRHSTKQKRSKSESDHPGDDNEEDNNNGRRNFDKDDDNFKKAKLRNPRAFSLNSYVAAERQFRRTQDIQAKRMHVPEVDRTPLEPPPIFIAIVGPPKVGKSTLMQNLIRNYTRQKLNDIRGPVTVVAGKNRRITFYECPNDLNAMIDTAKVADLVLLMIDASFGFEMETFEFLNICQVHGFPRILGVLTHMDLAGSPKHLKKIKKKLKHRFWTEIYQGAKLFYLTGLYNEDYRKHEIHNLARFISVMKFKDLGFRLNHSFIVADRYEDLTQPDQIRQNEKCDRNISLYGYVRGCPLKKHANIHIPGCGDYQINDITFLPDPCELPNKEKKRTLDDRERLLYAPFSGVGGIVYDKDAVYIELGGSHSHKNNSKDNSNNYRANYTNNPLLSNIINTKNTMDDKLQAGKISLFSNSNGIESIEIDQEENNDNQDEETNKKSTINGKKKVRFAGSEDSDQDEDDDEMDNEENEDDNNEMNDESEEDSEEIDDETEDSEDDQKNSGEEEEEDEYEFFKGKNRFDFEKENGEYSEDSDDAEVKWKSNLKLKASQNFHQNTSNKKTNWEKLIYANQTNNNLEVASKLNNKNDDDEDNLFRVKRSFANENSLKLDNSKYMTKMKDWSLVKSKKNHSDGEETSMDEDYDESDEDEEDNPYDCIRDCFVTGKWDKSQDAEHLLREDEEGDEDDIFGDGDDDDEMFGDFEDFETGQVYKADENEEEEDDDGGSESGNENEEGKSSSENKKAKKLKSEMTKRERLMEKKKRIKEQFDREFDANKSKEDVNESEYYDYLEKMANQQSSLNRLEFEKLDDKQRVEYEGFRPGMYVRIEINKMPYEFIKNFDARSLLVVGSLGVNESNIGYVQVRLKKHRWHNRILKTKDPLIVSLGWRRFQTIPIYFIQDHNMRNRSLKYTPQHMYCHACFWGPITPQNTGFLAVQTMDNQTKNFRIAATGVTVDMNKSTKIVKKLKLIGTPHKIFRKTAFIQGMFTSTLEASKFEGASVKTVSGIRGQIKKALTASNIPAGSVRATFEDKILASDTIFLKSWYAVDIPKFYYPITNLLSPQEIYTLKTLGTLKYERNIKVMPNENSLYKPIEREEKFFAPLKINKKLEEQLPFKFKTKENIELKDPIAGQRLAVIREPEEAKMAAVMKMFKKVHENRVKQNHEKHLKQVAKHKKEMEKIEVKRLQKSKELKKQVYRRLGKQERRGNKYGAGGGHDDDE